MKENLKHVKACLFNAARRVNKIDDTVLGEEDTSVVVDNISVDIVSLRENLRVALSCAESVEKLLKFAQVVSQSG